MHQRPSLTQLLLVMLGLVSVVVGIGWCFTLGNSAWRIRQVFPGVEVYLVHIGPEKTVPRLIRKIIPSYKGMNELVTFSLTDWEEPLDLHERLSRLSDVPLDDLDLDRCRITRLSPPFGRGFPVSVGFKDCDFSELSPEDAALLQRYGKKARSGRIFYGRGVISVD